MDIPIGACEPISCFSSGIHLVHFHIQILAAANLLKSQINWPILKSLIFASILMFHRKAIKLYNLSAQMCNMKRARIGIKRKKKLPIFI